MARRSSLILLFTLVAGCSSDEKGLSVDVVVVGPSSPPASAGARTVTTDRGFTVTVTRGYLAAGGFDLGGCPQARRLDWQRLIEGTAYAHETGSPTHVGVPYVEPLLESASVTMGTLAPPPGSYCTGLLTVAAADDDAPGLPSADMVGRSLWIEGTWRRADGTNGPVSIVSSWSFDTGALALPEPLVLGDGGARHATLVVTGAADHWFDGVDFTTDGDDAIATTVMQNVRASIGLELR